MPDIAPHAHAPTTTQTSNDVTNFDVAVFMLEIDFFESLKNILNIQKLKNGYK